MTEKQIKNEDEMNTIINNIRFNLSLLKKLPLTREKALTITKLDEAILWAIQDLKVNTPEKVIKDGD